MVLEISYTFAVPTHHRPPSPTPSPFLPYGPRVTADEPAWTRWRHAESVVTSGFTLGVVFSEALDKYIMMYIHHHNVTHSSFTVLRVLYAPPVPPSSKP